MKTALRPHVRRSLSVAAVGMLAVALTSCTGRGGGQLPPSAGFAAPASFGFSFSCEDKGGLNPRTGQLHIELSYTDHGTNTIVTNSIRSSFSIHGTADAIDPLVESMFCSGPNPAIPPNELTFLGRYRLTSSAPKGFPSSCPASETATTPLCRFEVTVRDHDRDSVPSPGDSFDITLTNVTALTSEFLDPETVFYTRRGTLSSGNLTVD